MQYCQLKTLEPYLSLLYKSNIDKNRLTSVFFDGKTVQDSSLSPEHPITHISSRMSQFPLPQTPLNLSKKTLAHKEKAEGNIPPGPYQDLLIPDDTRYTELSV